MPRMLPALLISSALFISLPVDARSMQKPVSRSVEMITIGATAPTNRPSGAEDPQPPAVQVNELGRRLVEYRMAQEMASDSTGGAPPTVPIAQPGLRVAATSSIAIPAWLRPVGLMPATMTFVPGCGAAAYHPTGFLSVQAEVRRATYYGMMSSAACEHGVPVGLFDAMILRESGYDPAALSTKRAFGFAQLMPDTASALGVNRFDPFQNLRGGARYLRQQLDRFGRVELALAAYNAGPGRVRGGSVPAISETQAYVSNVIRNWQRLSSREANQGVEVIASR